MAKGFITSIERFKPHTFQAEQGEGLFISHSHEHDELTLILGGAGYYSSPDQNIKVSAGDLILIPSGLHHGFVCTEPWAGLSVHFVYDKVPSYCQYLFHSAYQKPLRIWSAHLDEEDSSWAKISLSQLEKGWHSEAVGDYSYDLMRIAFETVLLLFHRNASDAHGDAESSSDKRIIQEVLKEIHRSYNTPLTINEIASSHYLSESILRKKFTEAIGISPKQYIINLRIEEAKRLLSQTSRAIEFISSEVGFTTSSRFYEQFMKSVGMTPMEWRKRNQSE
ncbi:helix-turn-helix domain-containing protein [Paenibacillaceae bacterium WGS1546]|uniref:helix-turn-helix domain-containing protein n=1 Tax=Cohnella sp. WGS1546 TaxID=3366810 RepID=UPI00372D0D12